MRTAKYAYRAVFGKMSVALGSHTPTVTVTDRSIGRASIERTWY